MKSAPVTYILIIEGNFNTEMFSVLFVITELSIDGALELQTI